MTDDAPAVKAAATSFDVLEAVRELDGAGVSEIARHLDRSKSGVFKHLNTLTDEGYLVRRGNKYRVGLGIWALGRRVLDRFPTENAENAVDSLAASVDRTTSLVLYEGGNAVVTYVGDVDSGSGIRHAEGDTLPLHATAAGKVILAYAPAETRNRVLEGELATFTDETITDPSALRTELGEIRQRRTAIEHGEYARGVESVAAPILRAPEDPVGAIAISGTTDELDGSHVETGIQGLLVSASRSVENSIERADG